MIENLARGGQDARGPKPPRIKVGQIGVGHAHAEKLAVFRRSDDYEVVGVVEPDDRLREKAASSDVYRGVPWMTREQLLATPGLQAVLVETRVRDLLDAAEACVAAGVHVHLDKPAGESLPQYRRILEAATKKNLWVQMGYMYRYNPGVRLLRDVLKRGWLGEVFEVQAVMSKVVDPVGRAAFAEYPGGTMFELGCHVIDLVVGVLGAPAKVTPYIRHSSKQADGLLDNMLAVFEYPHATATVRSTALEVEGFERRHLTVCGTEGTFHIQPLDDPSVRLALSAPRGPSKKGYQDVAMPRYTRYVDDAADLARVIRGEKPIDFRPEHDLAVQTAVLQASGRPLDA
ncbi:Gfo/Idh/MocA family protein [Paludisphaera mucosa]|uniref:Gfo/Idh/MocA family oxidoreductase n=1 Tax=Paludisphaera mucosa TaxID=3030827 RepID=A0ABT6FGX9_9BACT|nr:Gfo/Idh/MocA family oxidoreductase [Paludisphaera mucosa]MDG3006640.1 Gfo/Idh/MocA family oxidoreductase [Paludisphaera mucosa]